VLVGTVAGVLRIELPISLLHQLARATHNCQQDFIWDRGPLLKGWIRGNGRLARQIRGEGGDLRLSNIATVAMMTVVAVITAATMMAVVAVITAVTMMAVVAMLTTVAMVAMLTVDTMATLVATMTLLATLTLLAVATVIGALGVGTGSRLPC